MDRRNFLQIVAAGVLGGSVNVGRGLSAVSSWTGLGSNSIFAQARGSDKAELKIRKVEPVVLRLPARNEDLSLYPQDYLMVRIETEEGIVGWGEGTNWPKVATVATEIEMDKDAVVGASAWDIEKIWNTIYRNRNEMHGSHVQSAMSAIDIALWDIVGQQLRRSGLQTAGRQGQRSNQNLYQLSLGQHPAHRGGLCKANQGTHRGRRHSG